MKREMLQEWWGSYPVAIKNYLIKQVFERNWRQYQRMGKKYNIKERKYD